MRCVALLVRGRSGPVRAGLLSCSRVSGPLRPVPPVLLVTSAVTAPALGPPRPFQACRWCQRHAWKAHFGSPERADGANGTLAAAQAPDGPARIGTGGVGYE